MQPPPLTVEWGLEYREAHTLLIDPNVLEIIDLAEARRHRALPLEMGADGPIFAVAEPNEERFAAIRALVGGNASFVLVAGATLQALMNSKVFTIGARRSSSSAQRQPDQGGRRWDDAPPEAAAPSLAPQAPKPRALTSEASQPEPRFERREQSSGREPWPRPAGLPSSDALASAPPEQIESLLAQLAVSTGNLTAQLRQANTALEASQQELRTATEELAEAQLSNDRNRGLLETLRNELASSRTTNARVQDLVRELEPPTLGDAAWSRRAGEQSAAPEANRRIA